ncbi:DUF2971 domain-containing protein [Ciceribacter selenitireducens]
MDGNQILLKDIFGSAEISRRAALVLGGRKLIHYCSADTALRIIKNREIWLRNVRVMNDFMEVNHGFNLILHALQPPEDTPIEGGLNAVKRELDSLFPGLADQAFNRFRAWSPHIQNETYLTCLSEHLDGEETDGRLSMWRNYSAGQAGVGIVINTALFGSDDDSLGVFSSPVFYNTDVDLDAMLQGIAAKIKQNAPQLASIERERVLGMYFLMLRTISHGSKHPGFKEEREWRVFHTYGLDQLRILKIHSETIGGVPQRILKLPLDAGVPGLSIPELVAGILIGPSQYQAVIGNALLDELGRAGVENPGKLIKYSPIPLRT